MRAGGGQRRVDALGTVVDAAGLRPRPGLAPAALPGHEEQRNGHHRPDGEGAVDEDGDGGQGQLGPTDALQRRQDVPEDVQGARRVELPEADLEDQQRQMEAEEAEAGGDGERRAVLA